MEITGINSNNTKQNQYQVSIICLTYNHVRYIKKCLNSLISQVTSFKYKILIHDDASNDGTTDIIREYASRYPEKIVPIIEDQNIYSQGLSCLSSIEPLLEGEYIAICEGDDWWTDKEKLQKQFNYMSKHPECSLCVHDAIIYNDKLGIITGAFPSSGPERNITIEQIIEGGGGYLATNSFFYRREYFYLPKPYQGWGVGDYPRMIFLGTQGSIHFLDGIMSAYRNDASGSWSEVHSASIKIWEDTAEKIVIGLKEFDKSTKYVYHESVKMGIFRLKYPIYIKNHDLKSLVTDGNLWQFRKLPIKEQIKSAIKIILPNCLINIIVKICHTVSIRNIRSR